MPFVGVNSSNLLFQLSHTADGHCCSAVEIRPNDKDQWTGFIWKNIPTKSTHNSKSPSSIYCNHKHIAAHSLYYSVLTIYRIHIMRTHVDMLHTLWSVTTLTIRSVCHFVKFFHNDLINVELFVVLWNNGKFIK